MKSIFVTGTDTDVGKTFVVCALLEKLRSQGIDAVGFKPVECGPDRADSKSIAEVCGLGVEEVNPIWYRTPVAPTAAATIEGEKWDEEKVLAQFSKLEAAHDFVLVEGAGGWLVPIAENYLVSNLAIAIGVPVLVVAANRLGVLNHTALTVNAVAAELDWLGVVLNDVSEIGDDESKSTNATILRGQGIEPVWAWGFEKSCPPELISALSD